MSPRSPKEALDKIREKRIHMFSRGKSPPTSGGASQRSDAQSMGYSSNPGMQPSASLPPFTSPNLAGLGSSVSGSYPRYPGSPFHHPGVLASGPLYPPGSAAFEPNYPPPPGTTKPFFPVDHSPRPLYPPSPNGLMGGNTPHRYGPPYPPAINGLNSIKGDVNPHPFALKPNSDFIDVARLPEPPRGMHSGSRFPPQPQQSHQSWSGPKPLAVDTSFNSRSAQNSSPQQQRFNFPWDPAPRSPVASGPSMPSVAASIDSRLVSEDEKLARQLQAYYNSEKPPQPSNQPDWSSSPYKSDEEFAQALAIGFDQFSGQPVTPLAKGNSTSIEVDEKDARFFQESKNIGDPPARSPYERWSAQEFSTQQTPDLVHAKQNTPLPLGLMATSDKLAAEIDLQADVEPLHRFGQQILKAECAHCRKHLIYSEKNVIKLSRKWFNGNDRVDSVLECGSCSKFTCIGCGALRAPPHVFARKTPEPQQSTDIVCHCDSGRLFLVWTLLCAPDHQKAGNDRRGDLYFAKQRSSSDPTRRSGGRGNRKSNGTGYGGNDMYGAYDFHDEYDDYLGDFHPTLKIPHPIMYRRGIGHRAPAQTAKSKDNTEDVLLRQIFRNLAQILPRLDTEKPKPFDLDPPTVLLAMLRRSPVLEKTANLLRNDSLEDITKRTNLYRALIDFVERLASHPSTAQAVHEERIVYPSDSGLLSVSFNEHKYDLRGKSKFKAETARPIADIFTGLQVSARLMLQRSKAAAEEFKTGDGAEMLGVCRRICEISDFLKANSMPQEELGYKGKGKAPVEPKENLSQWHREHCVDEVPDECFEKNFCYYREATTGSTQPRKGRMKHLMTELATLQTSLPEGIFIRHGSSRLDMMKVLIVGPHGTPYEGGLFEFDLYCPMNYPNEAPKMHFKTTGGGVAHFNPNLYTDGKVCLSLLGTWSGQPWMPGQSTLLQVFVSIQSMIFCDEPWYNEPGRENNPNPTASKEYNIQIQSLTLAHALTGWLRDPRTPDFKKKSEFWGEIVDKHFNAHGDKILAKTKQWAKDAEAGKQDPNPVPRRMDYYTGYAGAMRMPGLVHDFEKALAAAMGKGGGAAQGHSGSSTPGNEAKRKYPDSPPPGYVDSLRWYK